MLNVMHPRTSRAARDAHPRAPRPAEHAPRPGFTLIELLVVIGVVMILLGFLLPGFQSSRDRAHSVMQMSNTRQNALLIDLYCSMYDEVYPIGDLDAGPASSRVSWFNFLAIAGLYDDLGSTPAEGMDRIHARDHVLSTTLVYDPQKMRPDTAGPRPFRDSAMPIRRTRVKFPSLKGILVRENIDWGPIQSSYWCCPPVPPRAPVPMADMSIVEGDWTEFLPHGRLYILHGVGVPVKSTWYGCYGRDR